ncbi:MAG TPA: GNAT family N-acetyltransferase [Puia sp.]|jgi:ribosomal protein S18 acetylase RimI-like enzyme|nr:GNAT family N-acetyltransferase [Puia sp.]
MKVYNIRQAGEADIAALLELCCEHAEYENASYLLRNQAAGLAEGIFQEPVRLFCWVVENGNGLAGYCTYTLEYATWKAAHFIHMDCLYLRKDARNQGLGKALMEKMILHARALNIDEIQWQTPDTNVDAIRFYKRIGAMSKKKIRFFLDPLNY